ncbi:type II toxin-antitoxin system RelE/ParE family toxin [Lactobacillus crispatus]|uniref:Type II toxin-antitoxin system RelE/ParE family toxin n=2 Tax=Lactobacillus crispatus TaxID=47770 RepID=A0A4V3BI10_9LACO|nr:type II toxin-antitoxin system RelE/ParE family toxin [Lactobacillus crispatus]EKB61936.1 hypothetical protein HMPREF9249_02521 [Lactobacillus crispatus FB077-07]MBG0720192.1 type II toxin-antitoxin system RelE/ParE family toxin [Lactobacillus crispatus]MBI1710944.1 hypothetical protein [Lactobacillus crispatus]MCT7821095.1 type II toxin-antitoxin system RelE/ParE family toxin [Lactobacillus crispatus]MCZ3601715.1 type II toxin-antitoxin system RelE/ParE family toxin [Lactobacillus crispatu
MRFIYPDPFMRQWSKAGLSLEDREDLQHNFLDYVLKAPLNSYGNKFPGDIIQGTGGAIKWRFAPKKSNKGKSGSYRTIYFVFEEKEQCAFFLAVYGKKEKSSLTDTEKNEIKAFIKSFKKER